MIDYRTGNILTANTEALVNTVNCEGYMGKGIAYQFKKMFPENNKVYVEACSSGRIYIGKVLPYKEEGKVIYNFPTKDKWRQKSKYDYIEKGLHDLIDLIIEMDIKSVAIPPLGCGNGGLEWLKVKGILETYLKNISDKVNVVIYEPSANIQQSNKIKKVPKLTASHLLLMGIKMKLNRFSKLRLQKTAYLINYLSNQNYFKFEGHHYGPYAHSLEILSKDIKEYQDYYGFSTIDAYQHAKTVLISESIIDKEKSFLPYLHQASILVNNVNSDKELELLTTILYLLKVNHELSLETLIDKVHSWSLHKSETFSEQDITIATNSLIEKDLIKKELYGLAPIGE